MKKKYTFQKYFLFFLIPVIIFGFFSTPTITQARCINGRKQCPNGGSCPCARCCTWNGVCNVCGGGAPACTAPAITSAFNKKTRVNAITQTNITWNYAIPTTTSCKNTGYAIRIVKKSDNNISNTSGCNMDNGTIIIRNGVNNKTLPIPTTYPLAWDTTYCWRVATIPSTTSAKQSVSPTYTFRTNRDPDLVSTKLRFNPDTESTQVDPQTIGLWHMDENSGTTVTDSSSKNNTGTASGTTITNGKTGKARNFDGINDIIYVGQNSLPTNTFTIESWFTTNTTHQIDPQSKTGAGGVSGQHYLFGAAHRGSNGGVGVSVGTNGISVYEHGSNYMPALAVYTGPVPAGWNHLAVVYKNKKPSIYLNGVLVKTGLTSTKSIVYAPYQIGGGSYGYHSGRIDEVRISNVARTATEINNSMINGYETVTRGTTTPSCTYMQNKCTTNANANTTIGGNNCWISGQQFANTDNSIILEYEYKDADTGEPNEAYEHRFAFVPKTKNFPNTIAATTIENTSQSVFRVTSKPLKSSPTATLSSTQGYSDLTVQLTNSNVTTTNSVSVAYELDFGPNFPTGQYDIYSMIRTQVYDGISNTLRWQFLPDIFTPTNNASADLSNLKYKKIGTIGIDNDVPNISVDEPTITSSLSFDLNWLNSEKNESGLAILDTYASAVEGTPFSLFLTGYDTTKITPHTQLTIGTTQKPPIISINASESLKTNNELVSHYLFPEDPVDSYQNYNRLKVTIESPIDNACNIGTDSEHEFKIDTPWTSTMQGTVISDGMIKKSSPDQIHNSIIDGENQILIGEDTVLLNNERPSLVNIATNFLASGFDQINQQVNSLVGTSSSLQSIEGYNDINDTPRDIVRAEDWYVYFANILKINKVNKLETEGGTYSKISEIITTNCLPGDICYISVTGDLSLENATCDRKSIILIDGELTINDELRNQDINTGCIFVVNGNITLQSTLDPKDQTNTESTAYYDIVEGYFITNGLFTTSPDLLFTDAQGFMDGLIIRGGVVANDFEWGRELGLRNNLQPAEIVLYDPRFNYLFEDAISSNLLIIREL